MKVCWFNGDVELCVVGVQMMIYVLRLYEVA